MSDERGKNVIVTARVRVVLEFEAGRFSEADSAGYMFEQAAKTARDRSLRMVEELSNGYGVKLVGKPVVEFAMVSRWEDA